MLNEKVKEDIIDITCSSCQAEYSIKYTEREDGDPSYCPFCGADIDYDNDMNDVEDEEDVTGYGGTDWRLKALSLKDESCKSGFVMCWLNI